MSEATPITRGRSGHGSHGFSLVELMVVIAIAGVVMAVSVPAYLSYLPRIRLREAAREIGSDMQYIKVQAIKTNTTTAVLFNPAGTYQVITDSGEAAGSENWTDGGEVVRKTVTLSDFKGVSYGSTASTLRPGDTITPVSGVTFNNNVVMFTNRATSNSGTVYIRNEKGDTMAVGVTAASGRVKTWYNYGGGWKDR
ncbi:MAG: prepilin-type N-terminal cleavage/methylation domain-containing protein [Desulfobacterales bacterium]|nr:prepilin-type N-terminal cleavage/methylation domain-containing protein [Desulfobacterales bacterium]